jgi:hypothetical protein
MAEETTVGSEAPAAAPSQLQLSDLMLMAQIIQAVSQRGAIKPEEFVQVGNLYDRLVNFLQATGALSPPKSADAPTDEQTTN